jgi:FtsH-binding integral membrane protein
MKDYFFGFLSILATNIPIYLIWVVGFILAVIRWRRHPEVSSLVLFALLVLFTLSIASAMQSMLPIYLTQELDYSYTQVSMLIGGIGIVQIILSAGAWIAVIVALFGWRKSNQPA